MRRVPDQPASSSSSVATGVCEMRNETRTKTKRTRTVDSTPGSVDKEVQEVEEEISFFSDGDAESDDAVYTEQLQGPSNLATGKDSGRGKGRGRGRGRRVQPVDTPAASPTPASHATVSTVSAARGVERGHGPPRMSRGFEPSSFWDLSTIWVGNIPIVRRGDHQADVFWEGSDLVS